MGFQFHEVYQQAGPVLDLHGITPIKTEPIIFRAIQELISAQLFTQQILTQQLALGGKVGGRSFISSSQRADDGQAYNDSAEQIQMLTQRVEDLERRLERAAGASAG